MSFNHFDQDLEQLSSLEKGFLLRLISCGIGVIFLTWLSILIQFGKPASFNNNLSLWAGLTLTTPLLYFAFVPTIAALCAKKTFQFSMDIPLIIAVLCAYAYSLYATFFHSELGYAYFDSILLILFTVYACRYLEVFCRKRVTKAIQNLSTLPSMQVRCLKADNQFHACQLKDIQIGDKLYISPGEYFPVDGILCENDTSVDESMITGEAHAIAKFTHDAILAGTCNLDKAVIIQATSIFQNSYFGQILSSISHPRTHEMPESASGDQIALWLQMLSLTFAAAIFCWWLPYDSQFAAFCLVCSLLVTCPCAMAIAQPLLNACAIEVCAKKGVLINNSAAFYKLAEVEHILFDKTGTLTEGNLVVASIEYFNEANQSYVLPLIAAIEKNTHHPIAQAIVLYAQQLFPILPSLTIERLRVFPGKGIRALVDGKFVLIGSTHWLRQNGIFVPTEVVAAQESDNHADQLFVHCAIAGIEVARIKLKDNIRAYAAELIAFIQKRHIDMSVLSGDHPAIVNAVAKQLGGSIMTTAQALPQEKKSQVAYLQDQGRVIAMVGDGLNDAPALKRADIGIAIGNGNPITILCADIVLARPELKLIETSLLLSKMAKKLLKQNYFLALSFNLCTLPFAAVGQLTPMIMMISLSLSILLVMANTARLKSA